MLALSQATGFKTHAKSLGGGKQDAGMVPRSLEKVMGYTL